MSSTTGASPPPFTATGRSYGQLSRSFQGFEAGVQPAARGQPRAVPRAWLAGPSLVAAVVPGRDVTDNLETSRSGRSRIDMLRVSSARERRSCGFHATSGAQTGPLHHTAPCGVAVEREIIVPADSDTAGDHSSRSASRPIRRVTPRSRRAFRALSRRRPRRRKHWLTWAFMLERVRRIELPYSAWEADVLPLNYTRRWRPPYHPAPIAPVGVRRRDRAPIR